MNRIFIMFSMVSLLVFHTSCNDRVIELESSGEEIETRTTEQKIQSLTLNARQGDVEAYKSLALCYCDGDGVEMSWINMYCMYYIYCQKGGGDVGGIIEFLDEGHPYKLLFEIMRSTSIGEKVESKIEQLKHVAPAEAKAINIVKNTIPMEVTAIPMHLMREAEKEGSELAVVFQVVNYYKTEDKTRQEEYLIRVAEKYPFFNVLLGDIYVDKYRDSNDFSNINMAIEYYYRADTYGMLIPKYANSLLGLYDYFGQKGLLEYDEQEIERLRILAKKKY